MSTPKSKRKPVTSKPKSAAVEVVDNFGLTDKQRLFVDVYVTNNFNATEAALQVYGTTDRVTAGAIGYENLKKPQIRARVDAMLAEHHLTANEVLARLAFHARGSMEDFIDADSNSVDLAKARKAQALGLIKSIKTKFTTMTRTEKGGAVEETEITEVELQLYDAQNALQLIGKTLNLFTDRSVNLNIDLTKLSDEELRRLAETGKL